MYSSVWFIALFRTCNSADGRGLSQLGYIGMNQLITDGAAWSVDGNSTCCSRLLSSASISAVLMLPQLESTLQHAVDDLRRCLTQSSHTQSPAHSSKTSADSGVEFRSPCDKTAAALRQLLVLVRYSRHVRQAITSAPRDANDVASKTDPAIPVPVNSFNSGTVGHVW